MIGIRGVILKVGIIDSDLLDGGTRHPNLALMKISGFYKSKGNEVSLLLDYSSVDDFDKIFLSKVFTKTKIPINLDEHKHISYGGTGFFLENAPPLEPDIEHFKPDYSLYDNYVELSLEKGVSRNKLKDYTDCSIGFTTRGCVRGCDFCVNKNSKSVTKHSPVSEFFDDNRKYIYLWDDNFLAYPNWEEILDELISTKKYFKFRQGPDIRLMTEEKAKRLSTVKWHGEWTFAFDDLDDRGIIEKKLELWKKYVKKGTQLYVLVAHKSQCHLDIVDAFERIKILMTYGCKPYIMRYEKYIESEHRGIYITLARWCNQPNFFKKKSFREFCKTKENVGSTLRYYEDFCLAHPKIAEDYFDLKFEDLNKYKLNNKIE